MRMTGAGPSFSEKIRRAFRAGRDALLRGLNGLAERLAVWVFYPLAAHPAGRALSARNLAANRAGDICGPLVLWQGAAEVCGLRFGKSNAGHAGCGPISVYNALVLLGRAGEKPADQGAAAAGPGPAGQGAAGQNAARQNAAGQNAAGQGTAGQNAARQNAAGQDAARQNVAGQNTAMQSTAAGAPPATLAGVIHTFEKNRALVLGGRSGASPCALRQVLRQYGIPARRVYSLAALEKALPPGGVAILMIWNDRARITRGAHFFAVQRTENGQGYAAYNHSPGRSPALAGLVGRGRFAAGVLLQAPEAHQQKGH